MWNLINPFDISVSLVEEVNIETASKSIVPFDELFATNMEYRKVWHWRLIDLNWRLISELIVGDELLDVNGNILFS